MATTFVAFNSNQIKSATDNVGTFSENPDIRWSFRDEAELDALDKRHRELCEAYKNGDREAFAEAAKLVADYARGAGYGTKVYHGTGADGFNVAKADASEAQNGEGAQAHGMGLYMAEDREVAKEYQENAPKQGFYTIGGRTLEELGITPENFDGANVEGLVQALHSWGVEDAKRLYSEEIENQETRLKSAEKALAKAENYSEKESAQDGINNAKRQIARIKRALSAIDKILSILEENGLSISDYDNRISDGKVFDWFANLNEENTLDEDKKFSELPKEIQEKIQGAIETLPWRKHKPTPDEVFESIVENDWNGRDIYEEIVEYTKSKKMASEHLLDHGIKGITYDGRVDGRCYVSFEGGGAVKLQDPFTFDDNGELIPLSKRFDEGKPDMRWKVDAKAEADAWAGNPENVRKAAEKYLSEQKGQIVVDPDRIRQLVPNYDISNNSSFVAAGDEILEVVWAEALKRVPKDKPVVLLTGNPAAGKGTAKDGGLLDEVSFANLVFDAPQNKFTSVEKRVKEAIDAGHKIFVIQIYNDPITSWANALKRGIGKTDPKTGKRDGGRFLPLEYFVRVYESAQGKVEKIESILKKRYGEKIETKYVDSTGNNPKVVSPNEALAWDYSISDEQLKKIEEITNENRERIEESARLRGDKENPIAVIGRGVSKVGVDSVRGFAERISGRTEQGNGGKEQGLSIQSGEGRGDVSRLRALLRQERSENPVIWASIVLAKEILTGRGITRAKVEKVLPTAQFDGSKQNYAVERAKLIAEKTKATQKQFAKDLDLAIRKAESDLYWQDEFVENAYRAFSKGGEEYGLAKQKLMQHLKDLKNRELNKVKGYEAGDFDVDLIDAILKAQEAEPKRVASNDGKSAEEEAEEEFEESGGAFEGDEELSGKKTPLAPSKIRDVIGTIRREVAKRVRNSDGDQKTLNEKYRKTLVNVLTDAMKAAA